MSDPTLEGALQMHPPIFSSALYFRKDPIPGPSWYEILKNTQYQYQAGINLLNIPNTRTKLVQTRFANKKANAQHSHACFEFSLGLHFGHMIICL